MHKVHKTNKNPEKISINPIQYREWGREGGGKSPPPTSFSSVTSTNVRCIPHNFLIFSFNPFATLV